ncbi:MAG: hypothetical protein IJ713_01680 [Oscillibacter sp.]|nr:hypothetical protein [Oscillibacter sp.]
MKRKNALKRLTAAALSLVLLLSLTSCGSTSAQESETTPSASMQEAEAATDGTPSDTLKGIYDALIAPDSDYSQGKTMSAEYFPEVEYTETLGADRITLSVNANGNEYIKDGSWVFVEDGDYLTAVIADDDYSGMFNVLNVGNAIGSYFGLDSDLISGYLNGLGTIETTSDNFSMTQDEAAGTATYQFNISGPWDMKELDQMLLNEAVLDDEPLGSEFISQGGTVGKMQYLANGSRDSYTALFAEYGDLDDIAYQSIVNLITLRKPTSWEAFLADFTELKDLETEDYTVNLDPDDETIAQIMGQRNGKYSYVLVRFGAEEYGEEAYEAFVPDAEAFADFYFRVVAGYQKGAAGDSLSEAQSACDVLAFATGNELWQADVETLRANMLEAWESLTDEERANFDANFPDLNELLIGCFADWEGSRSRFEDAGVLDTMEDLLADETAQQSWDTLSSHTWTLGNGE